MIDVVALGELLIDFATLETDKFGYPTMKSNPGGAPANFLATLNQFGYQVGFIGKVGEDTFGKLLLETLQSAKIATDGIVVDPNFFTTLAFVTFDSKGERAFAFARKPGADTQLTFEEVDLSLVDDAKVLHFGTLSLTDDPMKTTTKQVVRYAKEKGKFITFDPNLRLALWKSEQEAREAMEWGLHQSDFVKISEEEVEFLWGLSPQEGGEKILKDYKVSIVFITLGENGSIAMTSQAMGVATCPEVATIDTTGAGDIYGGSALSQLLATETPIQDLTHEELAKFARFASGVASLSTEKNGGIPSIPNQTIIQDRLA